MRLFVSKLFLSSSVSTLYLILSWMLDSGFTEMTKKQPCFAWNTESTVERMGLYKSNSLSAMYSVFFWIKWTVHLAFLLTLQHWNGSWHRILIPPTAYVLHERAKHKKICWMALHVGILKFNSVSLKHWHWLASLLKRDLKYDLVQVRKSEKGRETQDQDQDQHDQ